MLKLEACYGLKMCLLVFLVDSEPRTCSSRELLLIVCLPVIIKLVITSALLGKLSMMCKVPLLHQAHISRHHMVSTPITKGQQVQRCFYYTASVILSTLMDYVEIDDGTLARPNLEGVFCEQ